MQIPDYFLADLSPDAVLTPTIVTEACRTLKRNREQYLAARPTAEIIQVIADVARQWLDPNDPFRRLALERGPAELGFSAATLAHGLDRFFRRITAESLEQLILDELGHRQRLDRLACTPSEVEAGRAALARGPALLVHIAAGNIPNPALLSLILGLLARSAQFVKCARGATLLPRLLAHSIYERERKLGSCLELAAWPGGDERLEEALFAEAHCVTATGSDATLESIRKRLPTATRFLAHGHRLSFGYVTRDALSTASIDRWVERAATDVVAWNQLGCLSPHLLYVELNGRVSPDEFAERLAGVLARLEAEEPRGAVDTHTAATITSRRAFYEVRAAYSPDTRLWRSDGSTAWTVVCDSDPAFQTSCLHRFIHVKAVPDLASALHAAEPVRDRVSTVGLAATDSESHSLAPRLAAWGVPRICPLGRMQDPPLGWRHDGRPTLADLVCWTDWEQ